MAKKLLSTMGLPESASSMFASQSFFSANDVLCKTELDLMELLDVPLPELASALDRVQEIVCPSYRSVLSLWKERKKTEIGGGYLKTSFKELDEALGGGIPFGLITELVGAPGIGKTQFCLMLSAKAAMPAVGGLNRSVIYIDTERKFSSGRMMEIAQKQFPELCGKKETIQKLAENILVFHPSSLPELMNSLQSLEVTVIQHSACLVIIDSIAALLSLESEGDDFLQRQEALARQTSLIKFIAESLRIPVVVTNQVRSKSLQEIELSQAVLQEEMSYLEEHEEPPEENMEVGLTAALGIRWAHSVNIRLVLEYAESGRQQIKIVKSPMSAFAVVPYRVTSKGLELDLQAPVDHSMT